MRVQVPENATRADRLIPRDTDPQAIGLELSERGTHVRVQIVLTEPLGLTRIGPLPPRLIQIKPRLEDVEGLPVIQALRNDRAEHRRKRVTRNV